MRTWVTLILGLLLAGVPAVAQAPNSAPDNPQPAGGNHLVSSVVVQSPNPWAAGQVVQVTLYGVPGGLASFDLGPLTAIPMVETQPGTYRGQYVLTAADEQLVNPLVVGHLQMPGGPQDVWRSHPVPPPSPVVVTVNSGGATALAPGQTVQIVVHGTPGGVGTFDVGTRYGMPLSEVSPGVYMGSYTVQPTDPPGPLGVQARITVNGAPLTASAPPGLMISGVAPVLSIQSVSGAGAGPVMPGQILTFSVRGTPGQQATFAINGFTYPMAEVSPGVYVGQWTVPANFPTSQLPVQVSLADAYGHAVSQAAPWAVTVSGSSVPPNPVPAGNVTIDYPTMHSEVSAGFGVAGRAVPGASLRIVVYSTPDTTPGGRLKVMQCDFEAQANADGSYNVPVPLNGATPGEHLDVRVQSLDATGVIVGQDEVVVTLQ
ncbi:MAG TPA: hypothetical protein VGO93_03260 [Candidatus Xenobia bacterium]